MHEKRAKNAALNNKKNLMSLDCVTDCQICLKLAICFHCGRYYIPQCCTLVLQPDARRIYFSLQILVFLCTMKTIFLASPSWFYMYATCNFWLGVLKLVY